MKKLKLALIGFGNAGRAFAEMLHEKEKDIEEKYGCGIIVTAISTYSRGAIVDSEGIDLMAAVKAVEEKGHFYESTRGYTELGAMDIIEQADYDVMCEMTPLNIFTGQPATDHIKSAFKRKKHVVTANKGPVAWFYRELKNMAEENGLMFFCETTVMDGTPVFNLAENCLKLCRVSEISGILNSTTNYILEEMEKGTEYDTIISEGRKKGFIEADPDTDIKGYDAAAKVAALMNVLMDAGITPEDVECKGIEDISYDEVKSASEKGFVHKLLCKGSIKDGVPHAFVKPVLVEKTHMLAGIDSTTSVVSITTDLMGKITVTEHEPEIKQTAYGIFGDCLRVLEGMESLW